jgi:hypothetical protein
MPQKKSKYFSPLKLPSGAVRTPVTIFKFVAEKIGKFLEFMRKQQYICSLIYSTLLTKGIGQFFCRYLF